MTWFKTGQEGVEQAVKEDEARKARAASDSLEGTKKNRYWLKPKTSGKFTFLDSALFFFREHQFNLKGSWLNWETCLEEECPACDDGRPYSYVAAATIIDHSSYKNKKGEIIKNKKRLLVLKSKARDKIIKRKETLGGDLTGCMFEATRYSDQECSTGEDFDYIERVSLDELKTLAPTGVDPEEWVKPFDYVTLFSPRTPAEMRKILGMAPAIGEEESAPAEAQEAKPNPFERDGTKRSLKDLL